jgi:hypothetical protein
LQRKPRLRVRPASSNTNQSPDGVKPMLTGTCRAPGPPAGGWRPGA